MGVVTSVAKASLLRRPARALFAILGVAFGIAVVVSVFTVDHNTILSSQPDRGRGGPADLEVRPTPGLTDVRSALASVPGVGRSTAVFQSDGRLLTAAMAQAGEFLGEGVRVVAVEPAIAEQMGLMRVESGRSPSQAEGPGDAVPSDPKDDSVVARAWVGRRTAERHGLGPGDGFSLSRPRRASKKECVEGEVVEVRAQGPQPNRLNFTVAGLLADEKIGTTSGGDVVVVDIRSGERVFGQAFRISKFWVERDPEVDVERMQAGLAKDFAYDLRRGAVVGQAADERAFRNGVRLSGLMALALGLFVIFHTLSMSLIERVREVGILHALGTSRGQIAGAFFAEALVLVSLAGALGLFGGLGLGKLMLSRGISSLGITETVRHSFDVPWGQALALTGLGVGVALIGSVFPLLRARDADTVEALRGAKAGEAGVAKGFHLFVAFLLAVVLPVVFFGVVDLVGEGSRELVGVILLAVGVLALLIGTPLVVPGVMVRVSRWLAVPFERRYPFAGLLAGRAMAVAPARIAASVAAIALVTAAAVGLRGMTGSLLLETERWVDEAAVSKVFVDRMPLIDLAPLRTALAAHPEVLAIEVGTHRIDAPFRILGLDPEELQHFGPLAEDPELLRVFRGGQAMLISGRLAKQRGIEVGDRVPVDTPGSGVQSFRVAGITDAYGYFPNPHERAYGLVAMSTMERFFCYDGERADSLAVTLTPGADPFLVEAAVMGHLAGDLKLPVKPRFLAGTRIRELELFDIRRDFLVFDVILALAAILAGVGVLNGQLLSGLERAGELGILRALGASQRQIAGSVLLESLAVGLTGGALGLLLGLALVPAVISSLRVLSGLELPLPGLLPSFLVVAAGAVVLALVAGIYPIWRMNRSPAVRAVRGG